MSKSASTKPERIYLSGNPNPTKLPNLIEIQTNSYKWLFEQGVQELLDEINPIEDFTGKSLSLTFSSPTLDKSRITEEMARDKNLTYKAPFKARASLLNKETGEIKESDVFLGDFPLMTKRGTFIINGIERVVVTQIVRSYGVLFANDEVPGRNLFGAKIIPNRGAWLEVETNAKDVITVKIDRKRRINVTTFLRAFGYANDDAIRDLFKDVDTNPDHQYINATLEKDVTKSEDQAVVEVYKKIRPGDLANPEGARSFLNMLFFNNKRYDLGRVGRYRMNIRLNLQVKDVVENRILRMDDFIAIVKEVIRLNNDPTAKKDDIDHLANRRVRAVGELVQAKIRVGLLRMERIVKDRMSVSDIATVTPAQLVNSRPIMAVLQEFFASSQLSQFMSQTNPLAELGNKRTLSATGPGGLSRERAGFEVRDVHPTHYGRICPIETPEGPNIGLVGYLASYGRVNDYGFIESPYRKVEQIDGKTKVSDKIDYLDAATEERHIIAPASAPIDKDGYFTEVRTLVRRFGEPAVEDTKKIQYIDVSPKQILGISASLIPFIEHDEAARALMGANMQRQAVPVIVPQSPVVGTGMEYEAAYDSGQIIIADESGTVLESTAHHITVLEDDTKEKKVYKLQKFVRSNQATCINQRPIVDVEQHVVKGQVIADSSATDKGELALGQNVLVAFMSWGGGNFEDAIIISERMLHRDRFTSIHIEKYVCEVRDTKLGPEVITQDIPNVSEEALSNLDESGIVRIGAEVETGDILVGKITPKGETELSAEEKLLRAIFGEKAKDVRDASLRLPHGERGKVVEIKLFNKDQGDELPAGVYQQVEISVAQLRKIAVGDKLAGRHGNKGVISTILPVEDMPYMPDGTPVDIILNPLGVVSRMNLGQILETHLGWAANTLNIKVASPVFEGLSWEQIQTYLEKAKLPKTGKIQLFDGRSGAGFDHTTTTGINYIMKLSHLVDDKMHARSVGPYSMITQQPLGGKAQFGGQRFGEMEVWALEAYGAAHTLQEMLTVKSDDTVGRSKVYEAIIKGDPIQKPSIPESFNVLVKELQSLGLSVQLLSDEDAKNFEIHLEEAKKAMAPVSDTGETLEEILNEPVGGMIEDEEAVDKLVTEIGSDDELSEPVAAAEEA
ncbi:MAG: DNA-directed RNA polymerase subunit beta [Patescibacteria group bacterium]|jgi:DNA-directed RNA polymerase subunit beta